MQSSTQLGHAERIRAVLEHIESNLQQPLDAAELAEVAGFSLWHFYRVFREVTGKSVGGYIREKRLQKAALRLRSGNESVVDIALDVGYETHSGFTRAFRARFSASPARYRESAQTQEPKASVAVGIREDTTTHHRKSSDPVMRLREATYARFAGQRATAYCRLKASGYGASPTSIRAVYR